MSTFREWKLKRAAAGQGPGLAQHEDDDDGPVTMSAGREPRGGSAPRSDADGFRRRREEERRLLAESRALRERQGLALAAVIAADPMGVLRGQLPQSRQEPTELQRLGREMSGGPGA